MDKAKYFSRKVIYTRRKDSVVLVDAHDATASPPLDPWPGKIYLLADGQHSLQELTDFVSKQYNGNPPENLLLTLDSVLGRLVDADIVGLTDEPVKLPYYLATPVNDQDPELSKKLKFGQCFLHELFCFEDLPKASFFLKFPWQLCRMERVLDWRWPSV